MTNMKKLLKSIRGKAISPIMGEIQRAESDICSYLDQKVTAPQSREGNAKQYTDFVKNYREMFGVHMNLDDQMLQSSVCRPSDVFRYGEWANRLYASFENYLLSLGYQITSTLLFHRKLWEYIYIAQALYERGMLSEGKNGLGFAVGTEPLPALFARYGCQITATDLNAGSQASATWSAANQHADSLSVLYKPELCAKEQFYKNVRFKYLDMNNISPEETGYDFCWSSCAFEHLGSIELGKLFIKNMINCLKPGGVAVHTTEYNLSSNQDTLTEGWNVVFRRQDFEEMVEELTAQGHFVEPLDFRLDGTYWDDLVAIPPYEPPYISTPHFKLILGDYISTSFGLIIRKAEK